MPQSLPTINSIWIGNSLGPIHAGCLRSFLRQGHRVVLHVFDRPLDVPDGVELFDANQIMARSEIVTHRDSGSFALASDIYRYRILKAGLGLYVDCDVYCLKPFFADEVLFGWESDKTINGAVLALPMSSKILDDLIQASSDPYFIPWWIKRRKIRHLKLRKFVGIPLHVSKQPWGVIGPELLTHLAKRHDMLALAKPIDVFYPISYHNTNLLFDPELTWGDVVTSRTIGVHLSASLVHGRPIIPGSLLDQVTTD